MLACCSDPVLPARRRMEIAEFFNRRQHQEQAQMAAVHRAQYPELAAPVPVRNPEEEREYNANVNALRRELASIEIHRATLDARAQSLHRRLVSMGAVAQEEVAFE